MKKINKRIVVFTFLAVIINIFSFGPFEIIKPLSVNASNEKVVNDDLIMEETSDEMNALYNYINKMKTDNELLNDLDPKEFVHSYITEGKGNISLESMFKMIINIIFKEVKVVLKLIISVLCMAILCSLLKNLQSAFSNESISNIAFFACYSILIMILTKSFLISIDVVKEAIISISEFMAVILPILVTMIATSGGLVQAATMDPIVLVAVTLIPQIYSAVIIPLILVNCALQFANNLSLEHKIDNLCKLIKQSVLWIQGIVITLFIGMLTIRGITADTMDAVALKTTKFAVDNFIPIVGKTFSDAITSIAGYSLIIKNAITGIGLIIIILVILYPIIKIIMLIYIYKISAALVEPISDSRITSAISSVGDSMVLLLSCILSVSFTFFILLGIMASASKFIVGG